MAYNKQNGKKDEKGKAPDYVGRGRQEPDSDFFLNAGAAWYVDVNGKRGLSVKIYVPGGQPLSFLFLPPKDGD